MNREKPPENNEYLEAQLEQKINGAIEELGIVKENVASRKYDQEQLIAVHRKLDNLFLELTNEGLRPDTILQPIEKKEHE